MGSKNERILEGAQLIQTAEACRSCPPPSTSPPQPHTVRGIIRGMFQSSLTKTPYCDYVTNVVCTVSSCSERFLYCCRRLSKSFLMRFVYSATTNFVYGIVNIWETTQVTVERSPSSEMKALVGPKGSLLPDLVPRIIYHERLPVLPPNTPSSLNLALVIQKRLRITSDPSDHHKALMYPRHSDQFSCPSSPNLDRLGVNS